MKILLVWPKARTDPEWGGDLGAIAEPLALEYLAAAAVAQGHTVKLLDQRLHPDDLIPTLEDFQPDVVGITAFSMHVSSANAIARETKLRLTNSLVIIGGHHATFLPEDFFNEHVDYVVSGEGVEPFTIVLNNIQNDTAKKPVHSTWQAENGIFVKGGEPPDFNIKSLPKPNRKLALHDREHYFIDWMKPIALVRSTVGCPYRCSFCSLWQLMDGRYHKRDIDEFINELGEIEEEYIYLIDDEAFISGKRMLAMAEAIKKSGIKKKYFAYCRIDTLIKNSQAVKAWKEIGLQRLLIGIDAISQTDLEGYVKGFAISQIEKGIKTANQIGVEIYAQFVVNTNYTKKDFIRLKRFVEHHNLKYPSFTILTPLPGTPLLANFDSVIKKQNNGRPDWDYFDTQNAVTKTNLNEAVFRNEYRNLYRIFKGSYAEHYKHHTMPAEVISNI